MITLSQPVQQVQGSPVIKGESVSEVIKFPASEGVRNTLNLPKQFAQQPSNLPGGMPS